MRVYLYHNIIRNPQPENAGTITINAKIDGYNSTPASKLVVKSLARKIYKTTTSSTGERCTICLEEFNDGRRVVTLPCGHEFDDECVLTWCETNHDCPLCRFKLPCGDQ
ncbi:zinc finger family protein [Arabidopsis lyrata subsp. lyrata]|uniref:RING-type E3 ubiquitin transferase n=1 Tax=Arabidopsis lyrata subsp. lyrata TaxID=81972 RepID=D7KH67_ARALL|nr:zinc finger family protein [Arabidopsis lyrata subsp. lyrata]